MVRLLILCVFLTACGGAPSTNPYPELVEYATTKVAEYFQVDVKTVEEGVTITFVEDMDLTQDAVKVIPAVSAQPMCSHDGVMGCHFDNRIFVEVKPAWRACATLVHELGHYLSSKLYGHMDENHVELGEFWTSTFELCLDFDSSTL